MRNSASAFWKWFEANNSAYSFINEVEPAVKEALLDELLYNLHIYCNKLYFEIGGNQELIITAEGNITYFESVIDLISSAPKINDWTFIAFIPARDVEYDINYEDVNLVSKEIWFEPLEHPDKPDAIGIKLYTANYELIKDSKFLDAAINKLAESMIGEKLFALHIDYVGIDQLPDNPEEENLLRLSELSKYVAWKTKAI